MKQKVQLHVEPYKTWNKVSLSTQDEDSLHKESIRIWNIDQAKDMINVLTQYVNQPEANDHIKIFTARTSTSRED